MSAKRSASGKLGNGWIVSSGVALGTGMASVEARAGLRAERVRP